MRRSEIKADGTVYADDRLNVIRVVDTKQMWDRKGGRYGVPPYIVPSTHGILSTSSVSAGFHATTTTGFLVVMTTHEHVDTLTALDIPTDINTEDALTAWKATLPQSLRVAVLVSRDFAGTFENVMNRKTQERTAIQEKRERAVASDREATRQFETAEAALERHGIACHRHHPPSYQTEGSGAAYVVIRASDLTALLNRLHTLESAAEDA